MVWAFLLGSAAYSQVLPYKNPQLTADARAKDLLARMTWEEKFYQLFMIAHDNAFQFQDYQHGIFGIEISIQGMDDQPGQQMLNYNATWTAKRQIDEINKIQDYLVHQTRLGIPACWGLTLMAASALHSDSFTSRGLSK